MSYIPSSQMIEAVESRRLALIRSVIISSINADPSGEKRMAQAAFAYAVDRVPEVLQDFDPGDSLKPSEEWNKDYWTSVKVGLMENFSRERFEHILEVGRVVFGASESVSAPSAASEERASAKAKAPAPTGGERSRRAHGGGNKHKSSPGCGIVLVACVALCIAIPIAIRFLWRK